MHAISLLFAVGQSSTKPAGGAAIGQVVIATAGAMVVTAVAARGSASATAAGRVTLLGALAGLAERVSGLPGWAALPSGRRGGSLLDRRVRHVLGHLAAHRQRPRPGPARQPGPLLDPRRPVRHLRRRLPRDGRCPKEKPERRRRSGSRATGTRRSAAC